MGIAPQSFIKIERHPLMSLVIKWVSWHTASKHVAMSEVVLAFKSFNRVSRCMMDAFMTPVVFFCTWRPVQQQL